MIYIDLQCIWSRSVCCLCDTVRDGRHIVIGCVFFFQAEDGIRDLVRSRGLGDVYKRQNSYLIADCGVWTASLIVHTLSRRIFLVEL